MWSHGSKAANAGLMDPTMEYMCKRSLRTFCRWPQNGRSRIEHGNHQKRIQELKVPWFHQIEVLNHVSHLFELYLQQLEYLVLRWSFLLRMQYLKELKDPVMQGVLAETEKMLARGRMDLPLTLCFAAVRGDNLLLHQLLKRGLDPNETDNSGRTALVDNFLSTLICRMQFDLVVVTDWDLLFPFLFRVISIWQQQKEVWTVLFSY